MEIHIHDSLGAIDARQWNALNPDNNPFLRYEFLHALETAACLGEEHGWFPRHFALRDKRGDLIAACPAYIKTNSYGEFVFDWSWADAYEQHGLRYYPKLVSSIPYTPAAGQRILVHPEHRHEQLAPVIARTALKFAEDSELSGIHWLFTNNTDTEILENSGLHLRLGCQYHWQNHNYATFEDFLAACTSKRRKTIRRERRSVAEQNLELETRSGDSLSAEEWETVCDLYVSTFDRKWGEASLNQTFFETIGQTMGDAVVIVFARLEGEIVACSVMLKSRDTLYGRYWGCYRQFRDLHFEACFYQGIEYCIRHRLQHFEPGAQGEHKITRGFVPTRTWSAHKLFHPGFDQAIGRYVEQEREMMEERCEELHSLLPFRCEDNAQ